MISAAITFFWAAAKVNKIASDMPDTRGQALNGTDCQSILTMLLLFLGPMTWYGMVSLVSYMVSLGPMIWNDMERYGMV